MSFTSKRDELPTVHGSNKSYVMVTKQVNIKYINHFCNRYSDLNIRCTNSVRTNQCERALENKNSCTYFGRKAIEESVESQD